jgi:hypothetical protein
MNLTKADYEFDIRSIKRQNVILNLIKGISSILISSILGTMLSMLVIMTPDPNGDIHYKGIAAILIILLGVFIYGVNKVCKVEEYLKKGK